MTKEQIEACWRDPRNRRWGFYYYQADPRVIVPKRFKWMGWTVNAARPSAIPVTLFLLAVLGAPVFFVTQSGAGRAVIILAIALNITVVCLLCAYLSSRTA